MENQKQTMEIIDSSEALGVTTRAEIDMQISTAKRYPRDVSLALNTIKEIALATPEIAESCFYSLPRGKNEDGTPKLIEGKSIRLAEIVAQSWGNLRIQTNVASIDATHITAEAMIHDLQTNVAIKSQKKVKILDRYGKRYNEDMIVVTANAACSKAMRDAVFDVVPEALLKDVYEAARQVARGDNKPKAELADKRQKAVQAFKNMGRTEAEICTFFSRNSVAEITPDDVLVLRGIYNAIKDGELTSENCFDIDPETKGKELSDNAALKEKLRKQK